MNLKENDQIPNSEIFIFENNAPVKKNLHDLLKGKKVVLFGLPGAYTSVCSAKHLPGYVNNFNQYKEKGVDHIICISVNDPFVMNAWAKANEIENIKMIPDGSGKFTEEMQMLVDKDNLGFGRRSWRYACVVDNGKITDWFIEEGKTDNCPIDPYLFTNPEYILDNL